MNALGECFSLTFLFFSCVQEGNKIAVHFGLGRNVKTLTVVLSGPGRNVKNSMSVLLRPSRDSELRSVKIMSNKIAIGIQLLRHELCLIELLKADVATIKENQEVM